ncbi:MAG: hypothetical protein WAU21_07955 [Chitinophagales bacterium]|nr:hypothetical protein [Bacteroidota bacterium]MBK8487223.1 hypothetical protein [Bacteroidota bacterium]
MKQTNLEMTHNHLKSIVMAIAMIICIQNANAQFANSFGKQKSGKQHPVRVYFMAYDMQYPGIAIGPEYDFLYATHQKIQCNKGTRYTDKHLYFVPQFGIVKTDVQSVTAFVNIELDFKTIYQSGFIVDLFASAGYAQIFENQPADLGASSFENSLFASHGAFLPQFGIGTGYDFRKEFNTPIQVNFRVLSASVDMKEFIKPGLNLGITYNL